MAMETETDSMTMVYEYIVSRLTEDKTKKLVTASNVPRYAQMRDSAILRSTPQKPA